VVFSFQSVQRLDAIGLEYSHQESSFKRTNQLSIPVGVDVV